MLLVCPLPEKVWVSLQFCWHNSEIWLENGEELAKKKKTAIIVKRILLNFVKIIILVVWVNATLGVQLLISVMDMLLTTLSKSNKIAWGCEVSSLLFSCKKVIQFFHVPLCETAHFLKLTNCHMQQALSSPSLRGHYTLQCTLVQFHYEF